MYGQLYLCEYNDVSCKQAIDSHFFKFNLFLVHNGMGIYDPVDSNSPIQCNAVTVAPRCPSKADCRGNFYSATIEVL